MDPLTALGIASSVVQFVDFTSKLVSDSYELYKSNCSVVEATSSLEALTSNLIAVSDDLSRSLEASKSIPAELEVLCKNCVAEASKLLSVLESLKVEGSDRRIWKSFKTALKTVWSQNKIDSFQRRLDSFRQQITMTIVVSLKEQIDSQTDKNVSGDSEQINALAVTRQSTRIILDGMDRQSRWQVKVIDSVHSGRESSQLLQTYINEFNQGLLYSLKYRGMTDRYELIQSAHQGTFEWIFDAKNEMKEQPSFIEWLEGNSQLYWITGNPGEGKSTLMKFIAGNEKTRGHLATWAGSQSFHILSFYSWSSGHDKLQMSLEGLLRTLLHSAVELIPSLIPKAFVERFETFMLFGSNVTWTDPFRWSELLQSFRHMVKEATSTDRLVFFIAAWMNSTVCVSSRPYIQFEEAFTTAPSLRVEHSTQSDIKSFVESQLTSNSGFLTLQKLTPDTAASLIQGITTKASGLFLWVFLVTDLLLEGLTEGERLSELQKRLNSLPSDLEALFSKILQSLDSGKFRRASQLFQIHLAATKAKGMKRTRGSDSRYQGQTRRSYATAGYLSMHGRRNDLEYGSYVLESPDPPQNSSPFLDLTRGLTLLDLSFADEDMDIIFDMPVGDFREGEAEARAEMMRRRLTTCCKCLLQVHKDPKSSLARSTVGYLHPTARDFIEKPEVWKKLLEATEITFDVNQSLFLIRLAQLKRLQYHEVGSGKIWLKSAQCIDYALRVDDFPPGQSFLLNEIDFACAQLTARNLKIDRKSWANFLAFNDRESVYWTLSMPQTLCGMTFLHLAVKYQLVSYVKETLENCIRAFKLTLPGLANAEFIRKDFRFHISDLLTLALFNYDILPGSNNQPPRSLLGIENRNSERPNLELVRILLESGANLSAPAPRENASIWEAARRRHQGNSALLGVLKRYRPKSAQTSLPSWISRM